MDGKGRLSREQGRIQLLVRAGAAVHPETGKLVKVGLPFGPKPRLILAFLNTQAILTDSHRVEVEDSLTRFTDRIGFTKDGRTIRTVKEQLTRLSASDSNDAALGSVANTTHSLVVLALTDDTWPVITLTVHSGTARYIDPHYSGVVRVLCQPAYAFTFEAFKPTTVPTASWRLACSRPIVNANHPAISGVANTL